MMWFKSFKYLKNSKMPFIVGIWISLSLFIIDTCASKECEPPPSIELSRNNGTGDQVFAEGTVVKYFCDFSKIPNYWPYYRCENGQWTNGDERDFYCAWKTCGEPEIEHGSYKVESFTVGSFAKFQCDKGYRLKGSSSALCRIDREWRGIPSCEIVRCPSPRGIINMDRFQNTHGREYDIYGNEIYNTCEEGYNLIGPGVQKCENNGQWTTPTPKCERIICDEPYVGSGGEAYYDNTNLWSMAMIVCEKDAIFKGEEFIVCYEDGWSYGYCYGSCDIPTIENGVAEHSRIKHHATLEWRCDPGYFKAVHDNIKCNDGNLTQTPTCQPVEFGNDVSCPSFQDENFSVSRYHDKCYIFIDVHDTYNQAKQRCHRSGWSLLSIHNALEEEFVTESLNKLWTERTWLGITWHRGKWRNMDGSSLSYQNWFRGEGRSGWFGMKFQRCAFLEQRRAERRWNDLRCHNRARVICVTQSRDE